MSIISVDSIGDLRNLSGVSSSVKQLSLKGYYRNNPGSGSGMFYRSTDVTSADNSGSIIVDQDGVRWKRVSCGSYSVCDFGAVGDFSTDDTLAFQNAHDALLLENPSRGGNVVVTTPPDAYRIGSLVFHPLISLVGEGDRLSNRLIMKDNATGPMITVLARNGNPNRTLTPLPVFSNMRLLGNRNNQTVTTHGIYVQITTDDPDYSASKRYRAIRIINMEVSSFNGKGVYVDGGREQFYASSLRCLFCAEQGLFMNGSNDPELNTLSIGSNDGVSLEFKAGSGFLCQNSNLFSPVVRTDPYAIALRDFNGGSLYGNVINDAVLVEGPNGGRNMPLSIVGNHFKPSATTLANPMVAQIVVDECTGVVIGNNNYEEQTTSGDRWTNIVQCLNSATCVLTYQGPPLSSGVRPFQTAITNDITLCNVIALTDNQESAMTKNLTMTRANNGTIMQFKNDLFGTANVGSFNVQSSGEIRLNGAGNGQSVTLGNGIWDGAPLKIGSMWMWENAGVLRIKTSQPTSATDGNAVSTV